MREELPQQTSKFDRINEEFQVDLMLEQKKKTKSDGDSKIPLWSYTRPVLNKNPWEAFLSSFLFFINK